MLLRRPSFVLALVGLVAACGGTGEAQFGPNATNGGVSSTGTGGEGTGNTGVGDTTVGNTGGASNSGNGGTSNNGNAGSGNGNAGTRGNGGSNGGGSGGANGTGGAPATDSGAAGTGAPDASAGGSAGSSGGVDAAVDADPSVQTVACPNPGAILNADPAPSAAIRLPLCLLPDKCCYANVASGGTCAAANTACAVGNETFQCDGPEDCATGTVCCAYTVGAITTQAIIAPLPTTNTVCTSAQKCASLSGRIPCHTVSDCTNGGSCAAGGGLPAPFKVCGPIILPPTL